jgi:predicted RNA binding protein YcfA (HicA-like mRNA interferase family)
MKIPRDLKGSDLVKALSRHYGYRQVAQVGSHIILQTESPVHHRIPIPDHSPLRVGEFVSTARLRSDEEIYAANDEIYHIHWRVRDARLRALPTPPGKLPRMRHVDSDSDSPVESYDSGVVWERHYALNWLIGYCGQDWDDITTDT